MALITGSVQSEFHGLDCGRHETVAITCYPFLCHVFFVDCVFVSAVGQSHSFGSFVLGVGLWGFQRCVTSAWAIGLLLIL